jgi:hypothetical protein
MKNTVTLNQIQRIGQYEMNNPFNFNRNGKLVPTAVAAEATPIQVETSETVVLAFSARSVSNKLFIFYRQ